MSQHQSYYSEDKSGVVLKKINPHVCITMHVDLCQ